MTLFNNFFSSMSASYTVGVVNTVQRFWVLRQNDSSVLANTVHVSTTMHACDADARAGQ